MHFNFGPQDIVGIIRRRFFWAAIPFLLALLVVLLIIRMMDPVFESTTTLLVEDQQIRNEFVQAAVESDALQRIEAISARVQARDNMLTIADRLNLYKDGDLTATQRFREMQKDTTIRISRVVRNARRQDSSAITVRIAFRSRKPALAQTVTNALLTDFQSRSVELRTDIASETSDFLRDEEVKIRGRLDEIGRAINEIKTENIDSLPENRAIYERALDRATTEKARLITSISEADQSMSLLELQKPLLVRENNAPTALESELEAKRRTLETLQREYQDSYPDVVRMKQDVLALEFDLDPAAYRQRATREISLIGQRMSAEREGSAAYQRLAEDRADLQRNLRNLPSQPTSQNLSELQYSAQVQTLQTRRAALQDQLAETERRITEYETQIAATPVVEGQLFRLEQERQQLQTDLSVLRTNLADAERSESLELQSKGERLTPIERPTRPDQPISPDKPRLALMGFAAAGMIAALFALVPEVLFARVYNHHHLSGVIGDARVIEVPDFNAGKWSLKGMLLLAALIVISLILAGMVAIGAFRILL